MRMTLASGLCALLAACGGDRLSPLVETKLPHSDLVVSLARHDAKGHYRYFVSDRSSVLIRRFLGPAQVGNPPMANLIAEGSGRYRIEWSSGKGSAYTVIDPTHRTVVEDSNQANPRDQQF